MANEKIHINLKMNCSALERVLRQANKAFGKFEKVILYQKQYCDNLKELRKLGRGRIF